MKRFLIIGLLMMALAVINFAQTEPSKDVLRTNDTNTVEYVLVTISNGRDHKLMTQVLYFDTTFTIDQQFKIMTLLNDMRLSSDVILDVSSNGSIVAYSTDSMIAAEKLGNAIIAAAVPEKKGVKVATGYVKFTGNPLTTNLKTLRNMMSSWL